MYSPPTKKIRSYLELAKKEAQNSTFLKHRHGSVLVKGGSILNTGKNDICYHSFAGRFYDERKRKRSTITRHAEFAVLLGIDKSITQGAMIVVVRINLDNIVRYSKPCIQCMDVMKFCGIKKVIFTTNDQNKVGVIKL